MPLTEGCSEEALEENIAKLVEEGYNQDQAYAIALETAYDNRKKCGKERQKELEEKYEE
jgi:hypothetical protein